MFTCFRCFTGGGSAKKTHVLSTCGPVMISDAEVEIILSNDKKQNSRSCKDRLWKRNTLEHTHTHPLLKHTFYMYMKYISVSLSVSLSVINSLLGFCFSTPWASLGIQQACLTRPGECVNDSGQPIHAMLADAFGPMFVFPYAPQPYWWHLRLGQQSLNGGTPPCWMQVSLRFQMLLPVIVAALKALIILGLSALTHIACWLNQLHSLFVVG